MVKHTLKPLSVQLDEKLQQGLRERARFASSQDEHFFRLSSLKDLCALEHLTIPFLNPRGLPDQCTYEGHSKFFIHHFPASLKTLRITSIEFNLIAETHLMLRD